jgi:hypothetical protein
MRAIQRLETGRSPADRHTLSELKARLDIGDLASQYVQLTKRGSHELWGSCPFHQDRTPSFKADTRSQRFKCFGCGIGGDVLDFIAAVEQLGLPDAIQRLRELVDDPTKSKRRALRSPAEELDAEADWKAEAARAIWRVTVDIPAGLPRDYLVLRRQITSWDPDRLRWHPDCPWKGAPDHRLGCIVAPINDFITGLVVGVWRILPAMEGKVQRRGLGPKKWHASRLFHAPGHELGLAEGVEDALAAHELSGLPIWAALTAENLASVAIPARLATITIFTDADDVGRSHAHGLAKRLREEGREVRVLRPQTGKDPNDVLCARRAE